MNTAEMQDGKQDAKWEQMYMDSRGKFLVASYEAQRERTVNSFLKKALSQVSEERDAAIEYMKQLSQANSVLAAEKSRAEQKSSNLSANDKETIANLQEKLEIFENDLSRKSVLVSDLESKASYAHKLLSRAQDQAKKLQEQLDMCQKHLGESENQVDRLKAELKAANIKLLKEEDTSKKLEGELNAEKKARLEAQRQSEASVEEREKARNASVETINDLQHQVAALTAEKLRINSALEAEKQRSSRKDANHKQEILELEAKNAQVLQGLRDVAEKKVLEEQEKLFTIQEEIQELRTSCEQEKMLRSDVEDRLSKMSKSMENQAEVAKAEFNAHRDELLSVISLKDSLLEQFESKALEWQEKYKELQEEQEARMQGKAAVGLDSIVDTLMAPEEDCSPATRSQPNKPQFSPKSAEASMAKRQRPNPDESPIPIVSGPCSTTAVHSKNIPRDSSLQEELSAGSANAHLKSRKSTTIELFSGGSLPPNSAVGLSTAEQVVNQGPQFPTGRILDRPLGALHGRTLDEILARRNPNMRAVAPFPMPEPPRHKQTGKGNKKIRKGAKDKI